jgi:excisionase family DNA binding protein
MRPRDTKLLLSLEETSLLLGIGRSTLYRAVKDDRVPFPVHRIGGCWYVPKAALQRFLNGELDPKADELDSEEQSFPMPENGRPEAPRCAQPLSDPRSR